MIKACAMYVTEKEILNEDKTLKETVRRLVGYWPFVFINGFCDHSAIGECELPSNDQLFPTPELAMAACEGRDVR